ncbi:helix-turn-helix domain-containing protein [Schleiferilactobacillus perolens]|uniref:helix-turn-helix domain-containing protein n=2 Tax=Schleiferilactobacillus perolens TaxID=100468 RepID=UPI002355CA53|nr:helix-turn-helix domain-containing protein [Schleiferilactobacillus perolens]MCI2171507.1 helix-turn-helix domain-containing protein [Schleiferilactobacillus perolens]
MLEVINREKGRSFTINDLAQLLEMSYAKTYNTFQSLLEDIEQINHGHRISHTVATINGNDLGIPVDAYRLFLLKRSVEFQVFDYTVQTAHPNLEAFCAKHFISKSTLLRKIGPLRHFFESFGVNWSTTTLQFRGDEKQIRFVLNVIYWVSFHGQEWPFRHVKMYDVVQMRRALSTRKFDPVTALQLDMFLGVCRMRIATGYPMSAMTTYEKIFPGNNYFTAQLITQDMFPTLDGHSLHNENLFLQFYFHIVLSSREMADSSFSELYFYLEKVGGIAWEFTRKFFNFLRPYQRQDEPSLNENHLLVANFARAVVSALVMEGHRFDADDFQPSYFLRDDNSAMSKLMYQYFDQETDNPEFTPLRPFRSELHHNLVLLLAPYLQAVKTKENVDVYLLTERSGFYSRVLEIFLHDLGFVHVLPETAEPNDADVIITSLANPVLLGDEINLDPTKVFVWYADENSKQYYELYVRLRNQYTSRFIDQEREIEEEPDDIANASGNPE